MTITLHGSRFSTCTQRVMLVLAELDLSYQLIDIDMGKGEHKAPEYIQGFHPFGKVPALVDGPMQIFESRAICRYLLAKYASAGSSLLLFASSADYLATFEQAASIEYSYFEPSISILAYEMMFKRMMGRGEPDIAVVDSSKSKFEEALDYYDRVLQKQTYLTGNEASLVDMFHIPWLELVPRLNMEGMILARPNVRVWWDRLQRRPAWGKVLRDCALENGP
ncbi:hypothetical protein E4T42_05917 [Aureobasidium subglaciale]|nr:hypothetical protein E4T42_05917 [Aureobasidium subglaciale]